MAAAGATRLTSVAVAIGIIVSSLASSSCRAETVRLSFRPRPGARYAYRVDVHAVTTTRLGDGPPRRTVDDLAFTAQQSVIAVDATGTRVAVRVLTAAGAVRNFVVHLDRGAQLTSIERTEDLPATELSGLSLTEVFPAAAGTPPERPLRPGQRWNVDRPVALPGAAPSRLVGTGRLVALGTVKGRKLATVTSSERLVVRRHATGADGRVLITGRQTTDATTTRSAADGAVESMTAATAGMFSLSVSGEDSTGAPVTGTLQLELHSTTRRLR